MSLAGHASPGNRGPAPVTAGRLTPGYLHSGPARTPRRRLQRDRTFPGDHYDPGEFSSVRGRSGHFPSAAAHKRTAWLPG